ncbi:hypothetical protein C0991_004377, partial [Blastosporella zonata]
IVIRQLRDVDDPVGSVVRAGEVKLDRDLTLDTSKLDPSKPDATYYGCTSTGMCLPININGSTIARASDLEDFLRDVPGIALPVLLFMNLSDASIYWDKWAKGQLRTARH